MSILLLLGLYLFWEAYRPIYIVLYLLYQYNICLCFEASIRREDDEVEGFSDLPDRTI